MQRVHKAIQEPQVHKVAQGLLDPKVIQVPQANRVTLE